MREGMSEVNKKVDESFADDEDEEAEGEPTILALEEGEPTAEPTSEAEAETEAEQ